MTSTIRDAKSAGLGAIMDLQQVLQEFQREWYAPDIRRARAAIDQGILTQWDAHQTELQQLQAANPAAYQAAARQIDALRKKAKGIGG